MRAVTLTLVVTLAVGAGAAAAAYRVLDSNINDAGDLTGLLGARPTMPTPATTAPGDAHAGTAVNVLILGSDDRSGQNGVIGGSMDGMHSDTAIVAHVSADRTRVELISIPRDLVIDIPSCTTKDGSSTPAKAQHQINEAFAIGWHHSKDLGTAAACTWKTVETLTHVRLDGFIVVDFVGLTAMVDAIHGVPICLPQAYDDENTGLHVLAGPQVFDGKTAVQFARARHDIGDGSDTQRIVRQHDLMAAMSEKVLSEKTLTSPATLFSFGRAVTGSLTASDGFASLTDLTGFGLSLRHVGADRIVFLSMPTAVSPKNKNRVVWAPEADTLWARIAADRPVGEAPDAEGAPRPTTSAAPPTSDGSEPDANVDTPWTPSGGALTTAEATARCT